MKTVRMDVRIVGIVLLGAIAATALCALVGVGVGSLIRNQTSAVVVALVWVLVVEGPQKGH